jgi:hypothetical protein
VTKAEGQSRIDAVEVGELSYVAIGSPTPTLAVKYAYTNAKSGDRFGYGNRNAGWSQETLDALARLVELIETDVITATFEEGATTSRGGLSDETTMGGVPSL